MESPTDVHVWGSGALPRSALTMEEFCVLLDRAAQEVAYVWRLPNTRTRVCVGPGAGLSIELRGGTGPGGLRGCHNERGIVVWTGLLGWGNLTQVISHELWEAMVNPSGQDRVGPYAKEVADPVSQTPWVFQDQLLSNFVYPTYFAAYGKPPYDHLGVLTQPGHPEPGAYQVVNGTVVQGPQP